jgi:hypothetical protein
MSLASAESEAVSVVYGDGVAESVIGVVVGSPVGGGGPVGGMTGSVVVGVVVSGWPGGTTVNRDVVGGVVN